MVAARAERSRRQLRRFFNAFDLCGGRLATGPGALALVTARAWARVWAGGWVGDGIGTALSTFAELELAAESAEASGLVAARRTLRPWA